MAYSNPNYVAPALDIDTVKIERTFDQTERVSWLGQDGWTYVASLREDDDGVVRYRIIRWSGTYGGSPSEVTWVKREDLLQVLVNGLGEPLVEEDRDAWPLWFLKWTDEDHFLHHAYVRAENEAAARQAWIDNDLDDEWKAWVGPDFKLPLHVERSFGRYPGEA